MAYSVLSGEILNGALYYVSGAQSVIYDTVTYTTGRYFKGVPGITEFTYSGSGTKELNVVTEIAGAGVELVGVDVDNPVFTERTIFNGFAIEYEMNEAEKAVNEVTKIAGFALELIDYPFYSFEITETKL